ncbi:MAG: serine O-acetyltransferase, partial [Rhizomicrobium sp.]
MSVPVERFALCDPIWSALRAQALELAGTEPSLASLAHATILNHEQLEDALSYHL